MELVWYVWFYAALGWVLEMGFALLSRGRLESRKTLLFLPLCPVYGLGALAILLLRGRTGESPALFFLASAGAATLTEYATGALCLRCWGVRFWDYRRLPCQLHGHVCLPFSLLWGALAFPLVEVVHPAARRLWLCLSPAWAAGLTAAALADFICTAVVLEARRSPAALRWWAHRYKTAPGGAD